MMRPSTREREWLFPEVLTQCRPSGGLWWGDSCIDRERDLPSHAMRVWRWRQAWSTRPHLGQQPPLPSHHPGGAAEPMAQLQTWFWSSSWGHSGIRTRAFAGDTKQISSVNSYYSKRRDHVASGGQGWVILRWAVSLYPGTLEHLTLHSWINILSCST